MREQIFKTIIFYEIRYPFFSKENLHTQWFLSLKIVHNDSVWDSNKKKKSNSKYNLNSSV